jgi:hypothetical protein
MAISFSFCNVAVTEGIEQTFESIIARAAKETERVFRHGVVACAYRFAEFSSVLCRWLHRIFFIYVFVFSGFSSQSFLHFLSFPQNHQKLQLSEYSLSSTKKIHVSKGR